MSVGTGDEVASEQEVRELLEAAETWAIEAGELVIGYYGGRLAYDDKLDGTPVTAADRAAAIASAWRAWPHTAQSPAARMFV